MKMDGIGNNINLYFHYSFNFIKNSCFRAKIFLFIIFINNGKIFFIKH